MELQVMSAKDFDVEKVKQEVETQLEKYRELVVTEDNYEDMQKARREVVGYRTNLTKFGTEQKRLLKKPYDEFVSTLKEVLLEVDRVESPLNKQFEYFDNIKKEEKTAKINEEISRLGELYGVREIPITVST